MKSIVAVMIAANASAERFLAESATGEHARSLKDIYTTTAIKKVYYDLAEVNSKHMDTSYNKDSKNCLTCLVGDGVFCDKKGKMELNKCMKPDSDYVSQCINDKGTVVTAFSQCTTYQDKKGNTRKYYDNDFKIYKKGPHKMKVEAAKNNESNKAV